MNKKIGITASLVVIMMLCDLIYSIGYYDYSNILFEITMFATAIILFFLVDIKAFFSKRIAIWGCFVFAFNIVLWFVCSNDGFIQNISLGIRLLNFALLELLFIWGVFKNKLLCNWILLSVIAMLLFCVLSRCRANWPIEFLLWVLVMFTMKPKEEWVESTVVGISCGIGIGYVLIQSAAFLFRPFDVSRYKGMFYNSNVNALFYFMVYICLAFLLIYFIMKRNAGGAIVIDLVLMSSLWPLVILTQSRITLMGFVVVTVVIFCLLWKYLKENKKFIKAICLVVGLMILMVPLMFLSVRYIPGVLHHPIWFLDEYSEENVHSFDPINSEKYSNPWSVSTKVFNRLSYEGTSKRAKADESQYLIQDGIYQYLILDKDGMIDSTITINEPDMVDGEIVVRYKDNEVPGSDSIHPYIVREKYDSIPDKFLRIRKYIFSYFIENIRFWGNENENPLVYISANDVYSHSHNNYIWMGYCFGIPAMVIFVGLSIAVPVRAIIELRKKNYIFAFPMLIFIGLDTMGLMEWCIHQNRILWWLWFAALIPFTTLGKRFNERNNSYEKDN